LLFSRHRETLFAFSSPLQSTDKMAEKEFLLEGHIQKLLDTVSGIF
jgi:hypothetical protein